ncbi:hypothetical protein ACQJBY_006158 [Aegilops geniculata]
MGIVAFFRAIIFFVAGFLLLFAICVGASEAMREFFEVSVAPWIESSEFIFTWIDYIYNILPMVAFIAIEDWSEVFFDCFTPASLWLEAVYSAVFLVLLLVFVDEPKNNYGRVLMEFAGIALQLVAIIGYVLQKLAYKKIGKTEARNQNVGALTFFKLFGLAVIVQIQFKITAPKCCEYWKIAFGLAVIGVLLQVLQIVISFAYRLRENKFKDDPVGIGRVKLGAALIRVVTLAFDSWLFYARGYWHSREKQMIAYMTLASLFITCLVALARYIGPERLKNACDTGVARLGAWCTAIREGRFKNDICRGWGRFSLWVKGELLTDAIAQSQLRKGQQLG